jgi:hypothetical protein
VSAPQRIAAALSATTLFAAAMQPAAVQASDRPYLLTSSAAAEEDDDQVWSFESWWQRAGSRQVFNVAPEYAFDPTTSVQLELSRANGGAAAAEAEVKHLFNHIGRDGWGWGMHLTLAAARGGDESSTQYGASAKLLYSLALFDGDALLHLNAGLDKARGERREWVASAAFEHQLPWRSFAFAEVGREDRQTLLHAGVRHWIRRERFAVDIGVQQLRGGADKTTGVVIGLAWYDV